MNQPVKRRTPGASQATGRGGDAIQPSAPSLHCKPPPVNPADIVTVTRLVRSVADAVRPFDPTLADEVSKASLRAQMRVLGLEGSH